MMPDFASEDLDAELVFDRFLGEDELNRLQQLLVEVAPTWCSKLRLWRSRKDQRSIDISKDGALAGAVLAAAGERGETYRALVAAYGVPPYERFSGSAELRGAGPEMVMVISVDRFVVSAMGTTQRLGNDVAFQLRGRKAEGRPPAEWLRSSFQTLCEGLGPAWAAAGHPADYWRKVMSEGSSIHTVGRDFGRSLPGLFWLNFFGRAYCDLLGLDRLQSVPSHETVVLDAGVLASLGADPYRWNGPEFGAAEQRIRDHLGSELFFTKADPDRIGVVPTWPRSDRSYWT